MFIHHPRSGWSGTNDYCVADEEYAVGGEEGSVLEDKRQKIKVKRQKLEVRSPDKSGSSLRFQLSIFHFPFSIINYFKPRRGDIIVKYESLPLLLQNILRMLKKCGIWGISQTFLQKKDINQKHILYLQQ